MKLIGRRSEEAPILAVGILSLLLVSALTGLTPLARGASPSPSDQSGTSGLTSSSLPLAAKPLAPLPPDPSLSLFPAEGEVGGYASLDGSGFLANSSITLTWDGSALTTTATDATGFFSTSFYVPTATPGVHTLSATDGVNTMSTAFDVVSTVGRTNSLSATSPSSQTKLFFTDGLWWAFWGTQMPPSYQWVINYSTSPDGTTWTQQGNVTDSGPYTLSGADFSLWVSGNTLYYVLSSGGTSNSFEYRYGTLNPTGSITWQIPETSQSTNYKTEGPASIITDSAGNVWVALYTVNFGTTPLTPYIEVYTFNPTSATPTWTNAADFKGPTGSASTPSANVVLVPLPGDPGPEVGLLYNIFLGASPISITTTVDGSWSCSTSCTSSDTVQTLSSYGSVSAVSAGDVIYAVGQASGGSVRFFTFTQGRSGTSAETVISTSSGYSSQSTPSIEEGPSGSGDFVAFYGKGTNSAYYNSTTDAGATWSNPGVRVFDVETSLTGVDASYTSSSSLEFGVIGTDYEGGGANVLFDEATIPSIAVSPTQGPVGTLVTVTGTGFSVDTQIGSITITGGTGITTEDCTGQTTSTTGTFTCTFTVPSDDAAGAQSVTVSGGDILTESADTASATFTVTTPTITLSPAPPLGPVGTSVTVMGTGFSVSTDIGSITITDGIITTQTCVDLLTSTTGSFTCTFAVPSDDTPGAQTVTVTGIDGGADSAFATFTVTTPASSGLVQLSITLTQFGDYGSPLSGSNYFTVSYSADSTPAVANNAGGTLTILVDPNSNVSISAVSSGSNSAEQWCLWATSDGACQPTAFQVGTSDVSVTYVYYDMQVQLVNYKIIGGGNPAAPTFGEYATAPLEPLSFPAAHTVTISSLSTSYTTIWVLAGTIEDFQPTTNTNPTTDFQQWQAVPTCDVLFVGSISCGAFVSDYQVGPFSQGGVFVTVGYYHQYEEYPQFVISTASDAGTGYTPPTLTYYSAGSVSKQLLALGSPVTVWVDAGTSWSVDSILGGSWASERWTCIFDCSGTVPGTVGPPLDIFSAYAHQYLVANSSVYYYGCSGSGYPPILPDNTCVSLGKPTLLWAPAGQPFSVSSNASCAIGRNVVCTLVGWTTCYSWSALNGLPGDSGCPASEVAVPSTSDVNLFTIPITATGPGTVYADLVPSVTPYTDTCTGPNCEYVIGTSTGYEGSSDPVYVLVTGPYGIGQVGCNETGGAVDTMPLAIVSSCGGGTESITIANPVIGQYEVNLFPDGGTGAFNLTIATEGSGGNATGTPLFTSGTCTSSGGCTPFNVTEGADGSLSFSSPTIPTGVPQFPASVLVMVPALLLALVYLRRRSWPRSR